MPTSRPTRPPTARVITSPLTSDVPTNLALEGIDRAIREQQQDPSIPRSGSIGDVFYRAKDGRIASLPIGKAGQTLRVNAEGLPEWQ